MKYSLQRYVQTQPCSSLSFQDNASLKPVIPSAAAEMIKPTSEMLVPQVPITCCELLILMYTLVNKFAILPSSNNGCSKLCKGDGLRDNGSTTDVLIVPWLNTWSTLRYAALLPVSALDWQSRITMVLAESKRTKILECNTELWFSGDLEVWKGSKFRKSLWWSLRQNFKICGQI